MKRKKKIIIFSSIASAAVAVAGFVTGKVLIDNNKTHSLMLDIVDALKSQVSVYTGEGHFPIYDLLDVYNESNIEITCTDHDNNFYDLKNNFPVNAGTYSFQIKMNGQSESFDYVIKAKNLEDEDISGIVCGTYLYTGQQITPDTNNIILRYNDKEIASENYNISYGQNIFDNPYVVAIAKEGTNYTGNKTIKFSILPTHIDKDDFYLESNEFEYNGNEIKPSVITNIPAEYYSIDYVSNVNAGVGKVVISGEKVYSSRILFY